jgi:hypothetical protein
VSYCPEHDREECGTPTKKGTCHQPSLDGSCWRHPAGSEVAVSEADGEIVAPVHVDAYSVSLEGPVTPRTGMIVMLQVSWARWQEYARLLREQVYGTPSQPVSPGDTEGLVGHTYDFDMHAPGGGIYETGESPRALVAIEAAERDRFMKLAMQAHAMGIESEEYI